MVLQYANAGGVRNAHRHQPCVPGYGGDANAVVAGGNCSSRDGRAVTIEIGRVAVVVPEIPAGNQLPGEVQVAAVNTAVDYGDYNAGPGRRVPRGGGADLRQVPFVRCQRIVRRASWRNPLVELGKLDLGVCCQLGYGIGLRPPRGKGYDMNVEPANLPLRFSAVCGEDRGKIVVADPGLCLDQDRPGAKP